MTEIDANLGELRMELIMELIDEAVVAAAFSTSPGAMTWYQAAPQEHLAMVKHLTTETKTEEFIAGKGVVTQWERIRRQNHWLDALYNACAPGVHFGARLVNTAPPPRRGRIVGHLTMPDGRPWFDGESLGRVWRGLME